MADLEKEKPPAEAVHHRRTSSELEVDHDRAQIHKISPEDDARIRKKVDMVVLPMGSERDIGNYV